MIRIVVNFFLVSICFIQSVKALDTTRVRKIKVLPVPTIGYTPETDFYFGAVSLFTIDLYQDSFTRTSNVDLEFNYTLRNQSIFETSWNYFFRQEKWFLDGVFHVSAYPDFYYGIGGQTTEQDEVRFSSSRLNTQVNLYKKLRQNLFLGVGGGITHYNKVKGDSLTLHEELRSRRAASARVVLLYDGRNSILTPQSGFYFKLHTGYNFSQQNYPKIELDIRKYHTGAREFTVAGRLYQAWVGNTPPFFDYPIMGGDQVARGYFYGRFRDKSLSSFQVELRTPLWHRMGLAFIGGISSLSPNFSWARATFFPNVGLGLRVMVDKRETTNFRIDYAIGSRNQSGFYISFGESF